MARQRKQDLKKAISHFLTKLQDVHISISGSDLIAMGGKPGPDFAIILRAIKKAVLNEKVKSKEEQWTMAQRMVTSLAKQSSIDQRSLER